jgi:methionyl-tRNA formyltransferase
MDSTRKKVAPKKVGPTKVALVGNGKPAMDCVDFLREYTPAQASGVCCSLELVLADTSGPLPEPSPTAEMEAHCARLGIPCLPARKVNSEEALERLRQAGAEIIFSICNLQILKSEFIRIPSEGVVNLHNAPLPRYGGQNACVWAIVDGRKEHGVTCHYIDEGVDTGDIIAQQLFPIREEDTGLSLTMRSVQEGVKLFRRILPEILDGAVTRTAQKIDISSFHLKKEIPNLGNIDFTWPWERFRNFIRGLNFNPMPNPVAHPRAAYKGRGFYIDSVRVVEHTAKYPPGLVLLAQGAMLAVQVGDAVVRITEVRGEDQEPLSVPRLVESYGITPGTLMQGGWDAK